MAVALYLVRHAFAAHADPAQWPDDAERPVTRDGAERFRRAARGLRRIVPDVDAVLSSGFARSWQTAELLCDEAGWPEPEDCPALEVGHAPAEALTAIRGRPEESIALVGHEPYLSGLASLLSTGREGGLALELKKGGVVFLECDGPAAPGGAVLRWAAAPKMLRALDVPAGTP